MVRKYDLNVKEINKLQICNNKMFHFIFDRQIIYILAPHYVLHVHVFCSQCLVKFCPVPVRCLKETSWKVATDEIICLLQSHMQFRIGSSPTRI